MKSWAPVLVAILAAGSLLPASAGAEKAAQRRQTQPYRLGADVALICDEGANLGGACFALARRDRRVTVSLRDATGRVVDGFYEFSTAAGEMLGTGVVCGKRTFAIPELATRLNIYVHSATLGVLGCFVDHGPAAGTIGDIEAVFDQGSPRRLPKRPIDVEQDCVEPIPSSAGVSGVSDDGRLIRLDALVLLDSVDARRAKAVFKKAAESYAPLDVALVAKAYRRVRLAGTDAPGLLGQAKALYRGVRPKGFDIVHVLTSKDITVLGQAAVIGLADCIGGVRFANRAFSVSEIVTFENTAAGPFTFYLDVTAKTAAHEIGHVMGAQHHYADCVEGLAEETPSEPSPCTLMFNSADFISINFSALNGPVVRGHALDFAAP